MGQLWLKWAGYLWLKGVGIYDLNGWGINGLSGWGIYDKWVGQLWESKLLFFGGGEGEIL